MTIKIAFIAAVRLNLNADTSARADGSASSVVTISSSRNRLSRNPSDCLPL